jgi:WD40 repeat protein
MGEDEEATLTTLNAYLSVIDELILTHDGRIFGSAGDSVIAEFASPVEAVRCATEIQLELDKRSADVPDEQRMRFRIGVNLGDVIVEGDNLLGDGVNIAARLEALAPPGGVCVSDAVLSQVRDRLGLDFLDLGEHTVKNISRPVRVYRVPLASEERITSPFRGLDTFEFEHASLFFGRAGAIAATKSRLEQQAAAGTAFLLIYGMSGAGKSSLLRAGLLPALTKSGAVEGIGLWRYCLIRPSEESSPVDALVSGLLSETALPELAAVATATELAEAFRTTPEKAQIPIRTALATAAKEANVEPRLARLVIAVDQMEELFTVEDTDQGARERFVHLLAALAGSGFVWVVGTIRADFFHRCGEVPGFSALKDGLGSYELLPPTGPEIAQIIHEPARAAGLKFEEDPQQGNLADVLQQSAANDPGSLPLLEFVLNALYEAGKERRLLTFAAYRALGGLEGAIAQRADEVTGALPTDVQDALPAVISALTTVRQQDEAATSRPALRREVAVTQAQTALVDALIDARLLVSDEGAEGAPMVRFAHEALLSQWPLAREIIAANREFLATRSRVRADAKRWLAEDKNPDLLLPPGKRLAEAEDVLLVRCEEIDDQTIGYIDASISAQRQRDEAERKAERQRLEAEEAAKHKRLELEADAAREREAAAGAREAAARRLAQRTRIAAVITVLLAVAAGVGAIVGFSGQQEASRQAEVAERNAEQARTAEQAAERQAQAAGVARDQALSNQSIYLTDLSRRQTASGNATNGILLALEALPDDMSAPSRPYLIDTEAALYEAISAHREIAVLRGHENSVLHVAFSPSGGQLVSASSDATARIWDAETGSELAVLRGHEGAVRTAAFSPDGRRIVTASVDNTARLWNAEDGAEIAVLEGHVRLVRHALFSPDGRRIVTASDDWTALLWDATNTTKIGSLLGHTDVINAIAFSNDGRYVATASKDATARLWDVSSGTAIAVLKGHGSNIRDVAFSPDDRTLVTASDDETVRLWDVDSGNELMILRGHNLGAHTIAFSPDGSRFITASADGTARIDVITGSQIRILEGHERSVTAAAFSADGGYVVTASRDGTGRLWDAFDGTELAVLHGHEQAIQHIAGSPTADRFATASADATIRIWDTGGHPGKTLVLQHQRGVDSAVFSPSGGFLLTASYDGTARVWDAVDGAVVAILGGHKALVVSAAFSPDERHVLTVTPDGKARLWEVRTATEIAGFQGGYASPIDHRDLPFVNVASFSPDGSRVVVAAGPTAGIWDVSTGEEIAILWGHATNINDAAVSPDGKHVITTSLDHTARIWNAETGAETAVLAGHSLAVMGADFSPDGRLALTVSRDATARVWDVGSGSEIAVLQGHRKLIYQGAFSPDGTRIVTASVDGTARLWTVDGEALAVFNGHKGPVYQAAFSPVGDRVVTVSADGTARVWDAATGSPITILEGHEADVFSVAFSQDGSRVVTASEDSTARVFYLFETTQDLIDHARSIVPRELTACERKRFFLPAESGAGDCPADADQPEKAVFVTSASFNGNLGGLTGADAICQAEADDPASIVPAGTYLAWLSDGTDSPETRFTKSSRPYILPGGAKVAEDFTDLTSGSILHALDIDPTGKSLGLTSYWTGTNPDGTTTQYFLTCDSLWSSGDPASACSQPHKLVCFQQ